MTFLYNCRDAGDQYRITKFDEDMNPIVSYHTTLSACDCPAGERETCRHRQMLVHFLEKPGSINSMWFWNHDRKGWVSSPVDEDLIPGRIRDQRIPIEERAFGNDIAEKGDALREAAAAKGIKVIELTLTPKPLNIRRRI
jgi:hypothetical protein